jgi:hypothetical protein
MNYDGERAHDLKLRLPCAPSHALRYPAGASSPHRRRAAMTSLSHSQPSIDTSFADRVTGAIAVACFAGVVVLNTAAVVFSLLAA